MDDELIDELLAKLDELAREVDAELGLPLGITEIERLRAAVREWHVRHFESAGGT